MGADHWRLATQQAALRIPPLPSGLLGAPQEGPVGELTWGSPARAADGGLGVEVTTEW